MEAPWIAWEGAAAHARELAKASVPVSAFDLAKGLGLRVVAGDGGGGGATLNFVRREIVLNPRVRKVRRHGLVAHEVGHYVLRPLGLDSEDGASFVGGAMMLPRTDFDADLRRTAWSLVKLRERHPNASAEMIARRIVELRDAVATIIDNGRVKKRIPSPWLEHDRRLKRISPWERGLADAALEQREEVRGDELCYAVPLIDGPWRRVIVVCEAEQLSLRL